MSWHARLLVWAQGMDAATFATFFLLFPVSLEAEKGPMSAMVLTTLGAGGFVALKAGLPLLVLAGHKRLAGSYLRLARWLACAAIASGTVGAGFNLAAIVSSAV